MSEEQWTFEVAELLRVSCTCVKCGTQYVFDIERYDHGTFPTVCSVCHGDFSELDQAMKAYRQFRDVARRAAERVQGNKYTLRLHTNPVQREGR